MTVFALLLAAAIALAIVIIVNSPSTAAQGVNVQITTLDCDSDPEVVIIANKGTQPVEMTGWNLQSDPSTQESLPLMSLGFLSPGESILVESGPASAAAFTWSRDFVFRNNDPTDFAQLASDAGDVLLKVMCGSVGQTTPTAAPTATSSAAAAVATPTPTPAVLGSSQVPSGGGSPAPGVPLVPPVALIAMGSALLASGLAAVAIPLPPWRRRRLEHALPELIPTAEMPPPAEPAASTPPSRHVSQPDSIRPYLFLVAIVLAALALLAFLAQLGEQKRE
jgi:hypothetical protein